MSVFTTSSQSVPSATVRLCSHQVNLDASADDSAAVCATLWLPTTSPSGVTPPQHRELHNSILVLHLWRETALINQGFQLENVVRREQETRTSCCALLT